MLPSLNKIRDFMSGNANFNTFQVIRYPRKANQVQPTNTSSDICTNKNKKTHLYSQKRTFQFMK